MKNIFSKFNITIKIMGNFTSNIVSQESTVNFQDINITDALMLKNASINNERNNITEYNSYTSSYKPDISGFQQEHDLNIS